MRVACWGERWCLLMERTGITDMVEGWLALSAVVARVALQQAPGVCHYVTYRDHR